MQRLNIPSVLDRDYIARTLRARHSVEHRNTEFWECRLMPCSEIEALPRRLVADELNRIYQSLSREIVRGEFDQICDHGSSPFVLYAYLNIAAFGLASTNHSIWDLYRVSTTEWKKLSAKVESLVGEIEAFTQDKSFIKFLTDYWLASTPSRCPIDERPVMIRRQLYICQHLLPFLLREFAGSLRQPLRGINRRLGPKRWDTRRQGILDLLSYVRGSTGEPHWDAIANILNHFVAQYVDEDESAETFEPDALRKVWEHAQEYGLVSSTPE